MPLEIDLNSDVYEKVHHWLTEPLRGTDLTWESIKSYGPDGYLTMLSELYTLRNLLTDGKIQFISIEKGLLRVGGSSTDGIHQRMFERVAQRLAKESAYLCIYCGQHSYRKKVEVGWPNLCHRHHIEYVNQCEEGSGEVGKE
jgi:hypothetical protein